MSGADVAACIQDGVGVKGSFLNADKNGLLKPMLWLFENLVCLVQCLSLETDVACE